MKVVAGGGSLSFDSMYVLEVSQSALLYLYFLLKVTCR